MLNGNQFTTCAEIFFISDLPHRLMEDDVYKDMQIPKGSLVFGNIWYVTLVSLGLPPFFRFFKSPVVPISYSMHAGRWCAMKRYIRMLPLSFLNGSWYQLRRRWNARWIQKILCLGLAEGEFISWLWFGLIVAGLFRTLCIYVRRSLLRTRMFEYLSLSFNF